MGTYVGKLAGIPIRATFQNQVAIDKWCGLHLRGCKHINHPIPALNILQWNTQRHFADTQIQRHFADLQCSGFFLSHCVRFVFCFVGEFVVFYKFLLSYDPHWSSLVRMRRFTLLDLEFPRTHPLPGRLRTVSGWWNIVIWLDQCISRLSDAPPVKLS